MGKAESKSNDRELVAIQCCPVEIKKYPQRDLARCYLAGVPLTKMCKECRDTLWDNYRRQPTDAKLDDIMIMLVTVHNTCASFDKLHRAMVPHLE
jgi:hypothetical protein